MQPTSGRTRTPLLRHSGTAGPTSRAGLAPASVPTQRHLLRDRRDALRFSASPHSHPAPPSAPTQRPFGLDLLPPSSRTVSRHHRVLIHPTPHRARTQNLRLSEAASPQNPTTLASCSPCWSPRLEHESTSPHHRLPRGLLSDSPADGHPLDALLLGLLPITARRTHTKPRADRTRSHPSQQARAPRAPSTRTSCSPCWSPRLIEGGVLREFSRRSQRKETREEHASVSPKARAV